MTWRVRPMVPGEERLWAEQWGSQPDAGVFHGLAWGGLVAEAYGASFLPHLVERDGVLAGVWPVFLVRRAGLRLLASYLRGWATPYGGPAAHGMDDDALRQAIHQLRVAHRAHYFEVSLPRAVALEGFAADGFRWEERRTYILALGGGERALWDGLASRCRNMIRKADKQGVAVRDTTEEGFPEPYWEMAVSTWRKSGVPPGIPRRLYHLILERLGPDGQARLLVAERGGAPVAAAIVLRHNGLYSYWDGVSSPEGYALGANNLLQWESIRSAEREGGRLYDLLGANSPGIARFKQSFGGELRSYHYLFRTWGPRARLGRATYAAVRALRRGIRRRLGRAGS